MIHNMKVFGAKTQGKRLEGAAVALGGFLYKPKCSNASEGRDQTDIITNKCNRTVFNHPNVSC